MPGKTASGTWKSFERRVARWFGVERNSKRGLGDNTPDVVAPVTFAKGAILSIECKLTGTGFGLVKRAMEQAELNANFRHLPVAVLKEKYASDDEAIVVLRFSSFKKIAYGRRRRKGVEPSK